MTPCGWTVLRFQRDPLFSGYRGDLRAERPFLTIDDALAYVREHTDPTDNSASLVIEPVWSKADWDRMRTAYARRREHTLTD